MRLRDRAAILAESKLHEVPRRLRHVRGVAVRAAAAIPLFPAEADLLIASALLHDIGYSADLTKTGFHPLDGARFLKEEGFPGRLCALVAHHSCAYREAGLRNLSADLTEWQDEETVLRDALWWADMTTSPDGDPVAFDRRIDEIQERYGSEDVVTFFIRQAKPELQAAVERTEQRLRDAGISYE
jgi:HD domain-containing protein